MSSRYSYRRYYKGKKRPSSGYSSGVTKRRRSNIWSRVGKKAVRNTFVSRGPEVKGVDLTITGPVATIAASSATTSAQDGSTGFVLCTLAQQGDAFYNRDGNIVKGRWLGIRADFTCGGNTEASDAKIRCCVVLDTACNSANTTVGNALRSTSETGAQGTVFSSPINLFDYPGRFKLLHSTIGTVSKISGPAIWHFNWASTLDNMQIGYTGTANPMTYAQCRANHIYFIVFAVMTGAGTLPTMSNYQHRFLFTE